MTLIPFSIELENGQPVLVREVTPNDKHLLEIGFAHLSDRSKHLRFLAAHHNLTTAELDVFTATNGPDHVAIGALIENANESKPVGIARYVRLPDKKNTAEIAITISDDYQHLGLGSILLSVLAKLAVLGGISEFTALVLADNRPMLRLMGQLGTPQIQHGGAEIALTVPIARGQIFGQHPSTNAEKAMRKIEE